ncbi:MAG: hypothetical protein NTX64_18670 [Elusimicrobia bacterium]|nr:hypothetical protein [Elusimicrobiota bacterium]
MSSVGDVFDRTLRALRPRWKPLAGIMAIEIVGRYTLLLAGALGIVFILVGGLDLSVLTNLAGRLKEPGVILSRAVPLLVLVTALLFALALFETWMITALFYAAEQPAPTVADALVSGARHAGAFGWILTLASVAAMAGFLFLLVPGLLLCFAFMLAPSAYFLEGRTGWSALKRSWEAMSARPAHAAASLGAGWLALFGAGGLLAASGLPFAGDVVCLAAGPWIATLHSTVFRELTGKEALA